MKKFKLIFGVAVLFAALVSLNSCSDDNEDTTPVTENVLTGTIAENMTLTADKKYTLKGNVFIAPGSTLTIQPGTVIFGDKVTKGALVIERGAKIMAEGTETEPIVFTSSAPVAYRNYGDWGGVVILGKAQNNQNLNQPIEGITSDTKGQYGGDGSTETDNSGVLKYVRIEFAGIALSTDNELNGLTMGSVGSGTTIDHIQVSYSGDDSYEWFGGTVNAKYLVAYKGWDDDFDTDFGYTGNVQYAMSIRDANNADKSGSNGFESDNDGAGSTKAPKTAPKFSNVSWFGPHSAYGTLKASNANANYQFAGHLRRNSDIQIYNSVFIGSQLDGIHFDKTGANAVFKGNYFGRCGVNVAKSVMKETAGNGYVTTNFTTDNVIEADQATVDLSAKISGLAAAFDTTKPVLSAGSSLLTGAATVPAGLTQTQYIGAFDATTNWATGWTNFDPVNTAY